MDKLETMMIAAEAVLTETRETVDLSSPTSSCNEPPCRENGRELLSSSQEHDSDHQGSSLQTTPRLPGQHESLRGGVRG